MTAEEKILGEIAKLRTEVKELHVCIVGDKLRRVEGLVDVVDNCVREIYGCDETQDLGLKRKADKDSERIRSLELDRIKLFAVTAGVSGVFTVVWTLLKTFVFK